MADVKRTAFLHLALHFCRSIMRRAGGHAGCEELPPHQSTHLANVAAGKPIDITSKRCQHGAANTGIALRRWLKRNRLPIEPFMELDSFDLIINLVASGMGVAIVPQRALALYRRKKPSYDCAFRNDSHATSSWSAKWKTDGNRDINNPKVPLRFVEQHGKKIFSASVPPVKVAPASPAAKPHDPELPDDE